MLVCPRADPKALLENNEEASDFIADPKAPPDVAKIFAGGDCVTDTGFDRSGAHIFSPCKIVSSFEVDEELTGGEAVEATIESSGVVVGVIRLEPRLPNGNLDNN